MKYMTMVKVDRNCEAARNYEAGMPPDARFAAAMEKLMDEMTKSGAMVDTAGLLPLSEGAKIRASGGKLMITDGPFIESKEIIGGYAILRAKSKEEAIKMGKDFMQLHLDILGPSYEGELEIRQMFDLADFASEGANK